MADLIEVPINNGTLLFAAAGSTGAQAYGGQEIVAKATETFDHILDQVCELGGTIAKKLDGLKQYNSEVTFGIKVTGKGKFIIAETYAEASITIKLTIPAH